MYTHSMHYILHSIYDQRSPITNKFLYLFLLQSLHDYLCCRARHTHAPHLLQPTLPPLQSSICSKAIWSSNSMSVYLLDCFSARPSAPVTFFVSTPHIWPKMDMPIQYRFGRWIYNAIYIKDASNYLGILIQALVPYCPGSVKFSSHSDTIWPRNSL